MKIKVSHVNARTVLAVKGDEPWLAQIYQSFATGDGLPVPPLTGQIVYAPDAAGGVNVDGDLAFTPFLACGRCDRSLTWDLSCRFAVTYRLVAPAEPGRDKDLVADELDHYFIEDDGIDLELLVNEQLQLLVPAMPVRRDDKGENCLDCGAAVGSPFVAGSSGAKVTVSPFARLKDLKIT